jgi:hypothetical protein
MNDPFNKEQAVASFDAYRKACEAVQEAIAFARQSHTLVRIPPLCMPEGEFVRGVSSINQMHH